jgi:hypothetical protein
MDLSCAGKRATIRAWQAEGFVLPPPSVSVNDLFSVEKYKSMALKRKNAYGNSPLKEVQMRMKES